MSEFDLTTPVLLLVFNRPDTTKQVFEAIRKAMPRKLFIGADGPRTDRPDEHEKCEKVRQIATNVDWDCEVKTLLHEKNLGCRVAVSSAIDWFFENVEEGIILEDDCLPSQSFFRFCHELLEGYRDDTRVMHINGNNFGALLHNFITSGWSYHFCSYPQVWGWATWKRAWAHYRIDIADSVEMKSKWLSNMCWSKGEKHIQFRKLQALIYNEIDTWDYQWHFCVFLQNGLAISPKVNLISNIGFSRDATHTIGWHLGKSALPIDDIVFPLQHPEYVIADYKLDALYRKMMIVEPFWQRVKNKVKRILTRS